MLARSDFDAYQEAGASVARFCAHDESSRDQAVKGLLRLRLEHGPEAMFRSDVYPSGDDCTRPGVHRFDSYRTPRLEMQLEELRTHFDFEGL